MWYWGDKRVGYEIRKLKVSLNPWELRIWLGRKIARTDRFPTKAKAAEFARYRKRKFYGRQTPAKARQALDMK